MCGSVASLLVATEPSDVATRYRVSSDAQATQDSKPNRLREVREETCACSNVTAKENTICISMATLLQRAISRVSAQVSKECTCAVRGMSNLPLSRVRCAVAWVRQQRDLLVLHATTTR